MTGGADALLSTVEVGYAVEASEAAWAQGVLDAAAPWLHHGIWSFVATYRLGEDGVPQVSACVDRGAEYDLRWAIDSGSAQLGVELTREVYGGYAAQTLSQVWRRHPELHAIFEAHTPPPARDLFQITCRAPDGSGALLGAGLPRPTRIGLARRMELSRVAAHLGAAHRLRRVLEATGEAVPLPDHSRREAVLAPDGRVLYAEGTARGRGALARLREAALAIDAARTRGGRADPETALRAWKALVDGRWTVVEHFDSDGRRYLVALINPPELARPLALSPREAQVTQLAALGHSHKFIAYELGVHESTVSRALRRALGHLGLTRRADLSALFAAVVDVAPSAGDALAGVDDPAQLS